MLSVGRDAIGATVAWSRSAAAARGCLHLALVVAQMARQCPDLSPMHTAEAQTPIGQACSNGKISHRKRDRVQLPKLGTIAAAKGRWCYSDLITTVSSNA